MTKDSNALENMKQYVRHSGYPFENEIDKVLVRQASKIANKGRPHDVFIRRGNDFPTIDEEGVPTIRSVDSLTRYTIPIDLVPSSAWGDDQTFLHLNFLVDAKYTESSAWLFMPNHSRSAPSLPFIQPKGKLGNTESYRPELKELAKVKSDWINASGGKKVDTKRTKNEQISDRDTLTGMQVQMIKAVLSEMGQMERIYSRTIKNKVPDAQFYIPIIVTNAPIFVVKSDITLKEVSDAISEEELCSQAQVLSLARPDLAQISSMIRSLDLTIQNCRENGLSLIGGYSSSATLFVQQDAFEDVVSHFLDLALRAAEA